MRLGTTYKRADDAGAMRKLVKTRWDQHFRETKHVIGPGSKRVLKRTVLTGPTLAGWGEIEGIIQNTKVAGFSQPRYKLRVVRAQKQRPPRGADGDSDDSEDDDLVGAGPGAMVEADATPPLVGIELPEDQAVWEKVLDALKDITPPPRHPGPSVKPEEPPIKPEPAPMPPGGMMPPGWGPVQISL